MDTKAYKTSQVSSYTVVSKIGFPTTTIYKYYIYIFF